MSSFNQLPEPDFINRDPQAITAELVAQYEQLTGKTLYPAQVERLLIDMIAYRETLVRIGIQEAAKQNLVAYARAPMLDYLGELVGVTRLPAQPAKTTLRYTLAAPLNTPLVIPAGSRVESSNGAVTFSTNTETLLPAGTTSIDIPATSTFEGIGGNGWQPGQINTLVDEIPGITLQDATVTNLNTTSGGFEEENDDRLRERIKLAPESFTNAGSRAAYRFHALKTHQSIIDVAVTSDTPGMVQIYPLLNTGLPDATLLSLVAAQCSSERVRPLTDQVQVLPPTPVNYSIKAQLTVYADANSSSTLATANTAAQAFVKERSQGLGRDIVPSQIIAALSVPGVYQVTLDNTSLIALDNHQWATCTGVSISVAGMTHG